MDAVRAAVETQQAVAEHNSDLPKDKWIEFRVGINLGDVVELSTPNGDKRIEVVRIVYEEG